MRTRHIALILFALTCLALGKLQRCDNQQETTHAR